MTALKILADACQAGATGFGAQLLTLVLRQPEPIALLAMGFIYLWVYVRHAPELQVVQASYPSTRQQGTNSNAVHASRTGDRRNGY